ncbi:MAG: Nif3-like dinuclear metal center hexameric protein, partial [Victivallaceae bacterium]|nr:Nif3-like dinuclear metal center hexameric protein [Victivallaceae bacterium]
MARLKEITEYLDELLNIAAIPGDYSNNGLQVEAAGEVRKAVFGVDACKALFEAAALKNAGFIFVHHGISWSAEPRRFTGIIASRLELLFKNGISLYAVHLPLDAHPDIGHNALLADMVKLKHRYSFMEYCGSDIGWAGVLQEACLPGLLADKLEKELNCKAEIFGSRDRKLEKAGIVSGGGGMDALMACIKQG